MDQIHKLEPDKLPLQCKRCGHKWIYKGTNPYVTSCPYCRTTVSMKKYLVRGPKDGEPISF